LVINAEPTRTLAVVLAPRDAGSAITIEAVTTVTRHHARIILLAAGNFAVCEARDIRSKATGQPLIGSGIEGVAGSIDKFRIPGSCYKRLNPVSPSHAIAIWVAKKIKR